MPLTVEVHEHGVASELLVTHHRCHIARPYLTIEAEREREKERERAPPLVPDQSQAIFALFPFCSLVSALHPSRGGR